MKKVARLHMTHSFVVAAMVVVLAVCMVCGTSCAFGVDTAPDTSDSATQQATSSDAYKAATSNSDEAVELQDATRALTSVEAHGALAVRGSSLVDAHGNPYQLHGMSTHGIAWFPQYVNYDAFLTLRDDWNANVVRLAMYTAEYNGYCTGGDKAWLKSLVEQGVNDATSLGMYAIVDWHVMNQDANPLRYKDQAKEFFADMSARFAHHTNVLYEICNEPCGGTTWDDIYAYAMEVIPIIRANDPDAVVIVGTPTWSQEVDKPAARPLPFDNVMYSLHFYAATHTQWLRDRAMAAMNAGIALFVTEFGTCDASGNGAIDYAQSNAWSQFFNDYNVSYCNWSLCNKAETASAIVSSCNKTAYWVAGELSPSGWWIYQQLNSEGSDTEGATPAPQPPTPQPPVIPEPDPEPPAVDIDPGQGVFYDTVGHWVEREGWISSVVQQGLMQGYKNGEGQLSGYFGPDSPITREQVAVIVYRHAHPASDATTNPTFYETNKTGLTDVADYCYSTAALNWAYQAGIMTGHNGSMRPSAAISRAELAKVLYTYAQYCKADTTLPVDWYLWDKFDDAWEIQQNAAYAWGPFGWCHSKGIITGNNHKAYPLNNASRAEMAKMIMTAINAIEGSR